MYVPFFWQNHQTEAIWYTLLVTNISPPIKALLSRCFSFSQGGICIRFWRVSFFFSAHAMVSWWTSECRVPPSRSERLLMVNRWFFQHFRCDEHSFFRSTEWFNHQSYVCIFYIYTWLYMIYVFLCLYPIYTLVFTICWLEKATVGN